MSFDSYKDFKHRCLPNVTKLKKLITIINQYLKCLLQ